MLTRTLIMSQRSIISRGENNLIIREHTHRENDDNREREHVSKTRSEHLSVIILVRISKITPRPIHPYDSSNEIDGYTSMYLVDISKVQIV